jgi:hypothetical protein
MTKIEILEKKLEEKTGKIIISPNLVKSNKKIDYKKAAKVAEEIQKLELKYDCSR